MSLRNVLTAAAAFSVTALAVPLEERQNCGGSWTQCGGINWNGPTCCQANLHCEYLNDWYYQCLPGAATTAQPTTPTSTSTTQSSTTSTSQPGGSSTTTPPTSTTTTGTTPVGTGTATYSGNPFDGVRMWANAYYSSEVMSIAVPQMTGAAAQAAARVADVPSFMWMDTRSKIPLVGGALADIRQANQAGANPPYAGIFVVYDLPDRDCAAAASNGEYAIADGGVDKYKAYIDEIREMLVEYSDTRVILVIEPDSLANMVTNMNVAKCANAEAAYQECTEYAVRQLNLPNVAMYLDAGHAGWLGWSANIGPAAQLYANVFKNAGRPAALRGLATNVSNYNAWNATSPAPYTTPNQNYDEKHYVEAIAPLLSQNGWDAHFITDQGRSGKQPTGQEEWGHWCNAIGTGFGMRPSTNTGLEIQDAFVWIKPGGECDGTSDTTADRYDHNCGLSDALKPAPEAGQWFQAYFEQLLTNANPAF